MYVQKINDLLFGTLHAQFTLYPIYTTQTNWPASMDSKFKNMREVKVKAVWSKSDKKMDLDHAM